MRTSDLMGHIMALVYAQMSWLILLARKIRNQENLPVQVDFMEL